jgi:ABC-type dipeptide/oligopeptide/nickel transport system ATPase component
MTNILSRFRIESLHNLRNIDVTINDNKLVLVGENGTGKSTVVNLITFFLTRQWHKMLNYEFKYIEAQLGDKEIVINRDLITKIDPRDFRDLSRRFPSRFVREIEALIRESSLEDILDNKDTLRNLALRLGTSPSMVTDYLVRYAEMQPQSDELREIGKSIANLIQGQILYLPTYRRIEQDLRSIFPQLDLDEFRSQVRERFTHRTDRPAFLELVEFGMEDVEFTIQRRLEEIKDYRYLFARCD